MTVWCGLRSGGIIGPFFFETEEGAAVTVNGECYRAMLNDWFFEEIVAEDLDDIWFQQDGATSHTAHVTIDVLRRVFGNRIISNNPDVNWPPISCDLTPLDYYLWGAVKDKCYANNPEIIQDLNTEIQAAIDEKRPGTIEKVLKNWVERKGYCQVSRGGYLNEFFFHK